MKHYKGFELEELAYTFEDLLHCGNASAWRAPVVVRCDGTPHMHAVVAALEYYHGVEPTVICHLTDDGAEYTVVSEGYREGHRVII